MQAETSKMETACIKNERNNQKYRLQDKKGISEMPPQAVTLEPMVQGERSVATLRLLGGPSMRTGYGGTTFCWY